MILIEKDSAIDAIGEVHPLDYNARSTKARIEKLPTIEIVRCGECKYHPNNPRWYADNDPIETFIHCQFMKADDYCSKGKEQEDKE